MARYIDADNLVEILKIHFDALYCEDGKLFYSDHVCVGEDVDDLVRLVNEHPTADVVEVVRCKDCKHCQQYQKWNFDKYLGCNFNEEIYEVEPNHFCSYGEKKGGAE